jgi:preprotein translocase subunit SecA
VLVGTTSIETSEFGSPAAESQGHCARGAQRQAARARGAHRRQAGRPGAVTIATNMAGRGTDIVLGGNLEAELAAPPARRRRARRGPAEAAADWQQRHDQVIAAGGLHIIGTERHESRRIDNQLRGRSGRQGDPGSSRFYLSMEDNLMRIFGDPTRTKRLLQFAGMKEGEVIESGMLTRQIEKAQRKVERTTSTSASSCCCSTTSPTISARSSISSAPRSWSAETCRRGDLGMFEEWSRGLVDQFVCPTARRRSNGTSPGLQEAMRARLRRADPVKDWVEAEEASEAAARRDRCEALTRPAYQQKGRASASAPTIMRHIEKQVMLRTLDQHWREHLAAMDYMRQGIFLRSYAQKDPKQEYKREAFELFSAMLDRIKFDTITTLSKIQVARSSARCAARRALQIDAEASEPQAAQQLERRQPAPSRRRARATNRALRFKYKH